MPKTFPEVAWIFPDDPSKGKVQVSLSYFQYSALFSSLDEAESYLHSSSENI